MGDNDGNNSCDPAGDETSARRLEDLSEDDFDGASSSGSEGAKHDSLLEEEDDDGREEFEALLRYFIFLISHQCNYE